MPALSIDTLRAGVQYIHCILVPGNRPKTSSFRLPYQHDSSFADCTRELFKPSKDSASLLVRNLWKKFFVGGCRF